LALNIQKGNTGSFGRIKIGQTNVMDKIWDRNWRSLAILAGMKKPNGYAEPTKTLKK